MIILSLVCFTTNAKTTKFKPKSWVGVSPTVDVCGKYANMGVGLTFEQQLAKNLGYEFGGYYRSMTRMDLISTPLDTRVRHNFISVPLMFKYYNKIINVAIGLNGEFYLGSKNIGDQAPVAVFNPAVFDVGAVLKISKPFKVCSVLMVEPELSINPMFRDFSKPYISFGIKVKFGK